jgi:hypothetical protein
MVAGGEVGTGYWVLGTGHWGVGDRGDTLVPWSRVPLVPWSPGPLVPWSLVPGPWSLVPGPWSLVPGPWSRVPLIPSSHRIACVLRW